METINKLLKKQAPKINKKAAAAAAANEDGLIDGQRPNSTYLRWVNNKEGSRVSVPDELLAGPGGHIFGQGDQPPRPRMVEEVL